ncbi:hypothetical protein [Brevibacterium linens]|uniref:Uncharacterized protein n=1 Tax=Brevibacterium linens TaxID=1703 RepID=A0A2H1INW7_BRELN|nr:hypothetical protein [Brevibacterium linens]SMX76851.1 hypothetical protein BLIN101_01402 [Brevibacterium linens]
MTAIRRSTIVIASVVSSTAMLLGTVAPAQADAPTTLQKVSTTSFADKSCMKEVKRAYEKVGQEASTGDLEICKGNVTVEEGPTETVDVGEAKALAATQDMSKQETAQVVQAAKAGKIKSKKWKHAYWGGSNYEKHAGRTYWNGSKAWVKKYKGKTGYHTCHSEGSWQVGWSVKPTRCTKPKAGTYADSYYRFDASLFVKGSPITLGVGLHYRTSKSGAVKTWQVGG